jgi:hypothetical protein
MISDSSEFLFHNEQLLFISAAKWVCVACAADDLWKADTFTLFTSRMIAAATGEKNTMQERYTHSKTETAIILLIARLMCVNNLREQKCITTARRPRTQGKYKVQHASCICCSITTERDAPHKKPI